MAPEAKKASLSEAVCEIVQQEGTVVFTQPKRFYTVLGALASPTTAEMKALRVPLDLDENVSLLEGFAQITSTSGKGNLDAAIADMQRRLTDDYLIEAKTARACARGIGMGVADALEMGGRSPRKEKKTETSDDGKVRLSWGAKALVALVVIVVAASLTRGLWKTGSSRPAVDDTRPAEEAVDETDSEQAERDQLLEMIGESNPSPLDPRLLQYKYGKVLDQCAENDVTGDNRYFLANMTDDDIPELVVWTYDKSELNWTLTFYVNDESDPFELIVAGELQTPDQYPSANDPLRLIAGSSGVLVQDSVVDSSSRSSDRYHMLTIEDEALVIQDADFISLYNALPITYYHVEDRGPIDDLV